MDYKLIITCLMSIFICFAVTEKFFTSIVEFITSSKDSSAAGVAVIILEGRGRTKPGTYLYKTIGETKPTDILVVPEIGDVDLYVSSNPNPTYHLDNHDISAYSCGNEHVHIGLDFPRPYYIGIYCNTIFLNENCTFLLTVTTPKRLRQLALKSQTKRVPSSTAKSTFATFVGLIVEEIVGWF